LAKTAEASRVPRITGRTSGVERQAATAEDGVAQQQWFYVSHATQCIALL